MKLKIKKLKKVKNNNQEDIINKLKIELNN